MSAIPPYPRSSEARGGLTLVELLTSVAIALVLCVLATTAFLQVRRVLQRMQALAQMHQDARFLYQTLNDQIGALEQDGAMWIDATPGTVPGAGSAGLVFLMGKTDVRDHTINDDCSPGEQFGYYMTRCTDLTWSAWRFDQKRRMILAGTCSRPRQFRSTHAWGSAFNYQNVWLANMPQPLQSANPYPAATPSSSAQAALGGNSYNTGDLAQDLSDWQDLQNNLSPAIRNVTGCVFEIVCDDGTVVDASSAQELHVARDGCWVDGDIHRTGSQGEMPFRKRPRLIRVLVDMTEPVSGVHQSFSFSFQPPGMLPTSSPTQGPIP